MILDKRLELASAQAVTVTAISHVIDLESASVLRDIAQGKPLYAVIGTTEAATAAGAATVDFSIESDSTSDLATSPTVHVRSGAIAKTALVIGSRTVLTLPLGKTYERYLGLRFTVATGPLTAGKFNVDITSDVQNAPSYKGAPL